MPYVNATFVADLPTMSDHRDQLSKKNFNSTLQPTSPLHSLLPPPRDQLPITRLRAAPKFSRIPTRTKKYQSFLSYALAHYCILNHCFILLCFSFIIVSCFHLSLASWLLFSNKRSVQFSTFLHQPQKSLNCHWRKCKRLPNIFSKLSTSGSVQSTDQFIITYVLYSTKSLHMETATLPHWLWCLWMGQNAAWNFDWCKFICSGVLFNPMVKWWQRKANCFCKL